MDIKNAERVRLFTDEGEESQKVEELLIKEEICFERIKRTEPLPVDITIRRDGPMGEQPSGAHRELLPPILEITLFPVRMVFLGGLKLISREINSGS